MTFPLYIAPTGGRGCDTSAALSAAQAAQFVTLGYVFVVRYLTIPNQDPQPDPLTVNEMSALRAAGLAIGLVQMWRASGSTVTVAQGTTDAQSAVTQAKALSYPADATIFYDLEGGYPGVTAANLEAYLSSWCTTVQAAGYRAGLYNGPQALLTGAQLYALPFTAYWMGAALVEIPAPRGYQLLQLNPGNIPAAGTAIDVDVAQEDFRGDRLQLST